MQPQVPTHRPRTKHGQILILTVLLIPVLIGFAGLAVDAGFAFDLRRKMQTAADSAAIAAVLALSKGAVDYTTPATTDAGKNGFTNGTGGVTVQVNKPPLSGPFTDPVAYPGYVEVIVRQPRSTFFIHVLWSGSMTVSARAVAGQSGASNTNMVVLDDDPISSSNSLWLASSGPVLKVAGDITVNSPIYSSGSPPSAGLNVNSGALQATGAINVVASGAICNGTCTSADTPAITTNAAPAPDPLALHPLPCGGATSTCGTIYTGSQYSGTLSPGTYIGGITLKGNTTFNPGVYVLQGGGLSITSGLTVSGTGVTFYNTDSNGDGTGTYKDIQINGATVTLSAPTTGANQGMLFFQDRANGRSLGINSAIVTLTGVIYAKIAEMDYQGGGTGVSKYTVFVVKRLKFSGNATYNVNADFSDLGGGSPIKVIALGE